MMPGYHYQNDHHALKSLARVVYQPMAQLAIEHGEELSPLGMKVIYNPQKQYIVVPDLNSAAYENAAIDGQRIMVSESDFPKEDYFGEPLDDLGVIGNA